MNNVLHKNSNHHCVSLVTNVNVGYKNVEKRLSMYFNPCEDNR